MERAGRAYPEYRWPSRLSLVASCNNTTPLPSNVRATGVGRSETTNCRRLRFRATAAVFVNAIFSDAIGEMRKCNRKRTISGSYRTFLCPGCRNEVDRRSVPSAFQNLIFQNLRNSSLDGCVRVDDGSSHQANRNVSEQAILFILSPYFLCPESNQTRQAENLGVTSLEASHASSMPQ